MKRNIRLGILAILVLPLLLISSCIPPATPTTAAPAPATAITTLEENVAILQQEMLTKAASGSVSALETRMAQAEGNINTLQSQGPGNAYTKTQTYTKDEVDRAIADAISDLKNNQGWIDSYNSSSSSGPGSYSGEGERVDTHGNLELWVIRANPSSEFFDTDDGVNKDCAWWELEVVNKSNSSARFELELIIDPDDDCDMYGGGEVHLSPNELPEIDSNPDLDFAVATRGDWLTLNQNDVAWEMDDSEWINSNTSQGYYIEISLYQEAPTSDVDWTWDWRIYEK